MFFTEQQLANIFFMPDFIHEPCTFSKFMYMVLNIEQGHQNCSIYFIIFSFFLMIILFLKSNININCSFPQNIVYHCHQ